MRLVNADSVARHTMSGDSKYTEGWNDAIEAVVRLEPTVDIQPLIKHVQWIPCNDRLPQLDGMYLCSYENHVALGAWVNYGWLERGVIAWAPLPEPYKGEKAERS